MIWQTIDTAPKDKGSVLLYEPDGLEVFVGYYSGPRLGWVPLGSTWEIWPSHWSPLPDPPASAPTVHARAEP
jgi:hypothetical protein